MYVTVIGVAVVLVVLVVFVLVVVVVVLVAVSVSVSVAVVVVVGGDGDLSPVIIGLEDRRRSTSLVVSTLWWGHGATRDLVLVRWKTRWMLCIKITGPPQNISQQHSWILG